MADPTDWNEYVQGSLATVTQEGHTDFDLVEPNHRTIIEHLMSGHFRPAEHGCMRFIESNPEDSLMWTLYALSLWDTGDGDGVREALQRAHDLSNQFSLTWNLFGDFSNKLGDPFQATFSYEASLLIDGDQVLPRKHLYAIYKERGNWDKAFEMVRELVRLVPEESGSWENLDESLDHLGDPESGQELVIGLVGSHPTNYLSWWLMGTVMTRSGRMREAERAARRAVELCPNDPNCITLLGTVLLGTGRERAAIKHLRRATRMLPEKGAVWYNLGVAMVRAGMVEEGEQALQRFAELDLELESQISKLHRDALRTGKNPGFVNYNR